MSPTSKLEQQIIKRELNSLKERMSSEVEKEVLSRLRKIVLFPDDRERFEVVFGFKTEAVILRDKYNKKHDFLIYNVASISTIAGNPFSLDYDSEFQKQIAESNVIALVSLITDYTSRPDSYELYLYGKPIRRTD